MSRRLAFVAAQTFAGVARCRRGIGPDARKSSEAGSARQEHVECSEDRVGRPGSAGHLEHRRHAQRADSASRTAGPAARS